MNELHDKETQVLIGDLGYPFLKEYQYKLINCGIMEQGMLGIAAGMALGGLKPFVYTGAIFGIMRAYEQLRDDICYANLNVKLIGTGAAGFLGHTHNLQGKENFDDLIKNLPNLKAFYPQDRLQLKLALKTPGPVFIKL